eukprot:5146677-Pyramimonas_sp.AAC.1
MLLDLDLMAPGSCTLQSGPTNYGPQGDKSTLGVFATPKGLGPGVKHCRVAWRAGRVLQLIPSERPARPCTRYLSYAVRVTRDDAENSATPMGPQQIG